MAKKLRVEGKDVDAALGKALKELGLRRDQAEVTIITRGTKGFLGIGSKPAIVEVRKKHWGTGNLDAQIYMDVPKKKDRPSNRNKKRDDKKDDRKEDSTEAKKERGPRRDRKERGPKNFERGNKPGRGGRRGDDRKRFAMEEPLEPLTPAVSKEHEPQLLPSLEIQNVVVPDNMLAPMALAKEMLIKTLNYMGVKYENVNVWWDGKQSRILLTFDCDNPAVVIGKDGKTLEAIQYLLTLSLSRQFDTNISVMTDTQNYWRKTEDKLQAEITKATDAIKRGLSLYRLRPMASQMRRYIHRALANNELVETLSEGEGKWRKVVVKAKAVAAKAADAAQYQAAEFGNAAADMASETLGKIEDKVSEIKDAASDKAEEVKGAAQSAAESVGEAVKNISVDIVHKAAEISNAAADAVLKAEENLEKTMEKYVSPEGTHNNEGDNK